MSYKLATPTLRRAAGFILAAVAGRNLGGFYYPGGIVSYGTLLTAWENHGMAREDMSRAAQVLLERGVIRSLCDDRGLIALANNPQTGTDPDAAEMTGGGYFPEVVPITSDREDQDYDFLQPEASLAVGLGGSSAFDWDQFDAWDLDSGHISVKSHIARLLEGAA